MLITYHQFKEITSQCATFIDMLDHAGMSLSAPANLGITINEFRKVVEHIQNHPSFYPSPMVIHESVLVSLPDSLQRDEWPQLINQLLRAVERLMNQFDESFLNANVPLAVSMQLARLSDILIEMDQ